MTVDSNVAQYLDILLDLAFAILPTLALAAITQPLGARVAKGFIAAWKYFRPAVDEATDPAIVLLAKAIQRDPAETSGLIVKNMDTVASILKSATDQVEAIPPVETL